MVGQNKENRFGANGVGRKIVVGRKNLRRTQGMGFGQMRVMLLFSKEQVNLLKG